MDEYTETLATYLDGTYPEYRFVRNLQGALIVQGFDRGHGIDGELYGWTDIVAISFYA